MRIGVFGGSFDPVHLGHLWIAECAAETLCLDRVLWIPAATSPLKPTGPIAPAESRLQMLRLALSGSPLHVIDDREIHRGGTSYTAQTLASLHRESPEDELFLLIGSDSLATLPLWYQPQRVLQLAKLAVIQRGGEPAIDWSILSKIGDGIARSETEQLVVPVPVIEVASSELRQRIRERRSIRYRTPRAVESLIEAECLYR